MEAHKWLWFIADSYCIMCEAESADIIIYIKDVEPMDEIVRYHIHCLQCHQHGVAEVETAIFEVIFGSIPPTETGN